MFKFDDGTSIKKAKSDSDDEFMNSSDDSSYGGVYDGHLPIIGLIKSNSSSILTVYSLKNETAIHVWRFAS